MLLFSRTTKTYVCGCVINDNKRYRSFEITRIAQILCRRLKHGKNGKNGFNLSFEEINKTHGQTDITSKHSDYIIDESKLAGGSAEWLFFPKTEQEVIAIIRKMHEDKTPITISGGRTGIVGSAVPFGGAVISTDEMKNILGLG